jgi:flagellar biosynthesis regulator FlbT
MVMPAALRRAEARVGNGRRTFLLASLARVVRTAEAMLDCIASEKIVMDRKLAGHLMALRDASETARNELAKSDDT